jgi:hypothetical protein
LAHQEEVGDMHRMILGLAMGLALAAGAQAQQIVPAPRMSQAEGVQLFEAGGFTVGNGSAINVCGTASLPKFVFMDLNGDGALEAAAVDKNPSCYGGDGLWFTLLAKGKDGRWRAIARDSGALGFETSRTNGWLDLRVTADCVRNWKYAGDGYQRPAACSPASFAKTEASTGVTAADRAAAMRAAGFVSQGGRWLGGEGHCEAVIEPSDIRDLNGDGRSEIVVTESGSFCYGHTGQGFYIMERAENGWRTLFQSQGIPEFLPTKGAGGWPDIVLGGPGFCFPVVRFNGKTYAVHRQKEEQPGACARR